MGHADYSGLSRRPKAAVDGFMGHILFGPTAIRAHIHESLGSVKSAAALSFSNPFHKNDSPKKWSYLENKWSKSQNLKTDRKPRLYATQVMPLPVMYALLVLYTRKRHLPVLSKTILQTMDCPIHNRSSALGGSWSRLKRKIYQNFFCA